MAMSRTLHIDWVCCDAHGVCAELFDGGFFQQRPVADEQHRVAHRLDLSEDV